MSPQERALIDAIRDDPEDDLRRLVYADWLEEQDRAERAELIRVQIEPAHWPADSERVSRAQELIRRHEEEWLRPLAPGPALHFVRGMVELRLSTQAGVGVWMDKVAREGLPPWVVECRVKLDAYQCRDGEVCQFVRSPLFPHVTRLHLENVVIGGGNVHQTFTAETAFALAAPQRATALLSLSLNHIDLGVAGVSALARSSLTRLRELDLSRSRLSPRGLAALATSSRLEGLSRLVLNSAAGKEDGLIALVQGRALRRLTSLGLGENNIADARLRLLLTAPFVCQLTELDLGGNRISDRGLSALAGCASLSGLKRLTLKGNPVGDDGAIALLESPHLQGLDELSLDASKITEPTRRRIERRFGRR